MNHVLTLLVVAVVGLSACGSNDAGLSPASELQATSGGRAVATPLLPTGPAVPDPRATLVVKPGQSVVLGHCGVVNIAFADEEWEVENPPFDATNAPDTFSGFGSLDRDGDQLTFTDDKGARLTFVLWDGTPDPRTCA